MRSSNFRCSLIMGITIAIGGMVLSIFGLYAGSEAKTTIVWGARWPFTDDPSKVRLVEEKTVELFERKHPDIEIKIADYTDWETKLKVSIAGGVAPDVATGYGVAWRQFIESGCFIPLDEYISAANFSLKPFIPGQLKAWTKDGRLYSLPMYAGTVAVYVNEDLFDERGVQSPDSSWNWEKMLSAAKKLTELKPDGSVKQWGIMVRWGIDDETGMPIWIRSNGGNVVPPGEVIATKLLIDEPPALEAMRFVHSLIWDYKVAPTPAQAGSIGVPDHLMVAKGKAGMCYLGSWDSKFYTTSDYKIGIVEPFLGKAGRSSSVTTDAYAVVKGTKHPKEAVEFLMFLAGPEACALRATELGLQPPRSDVVEAWFKGTPLAKRGVNMSAFIKTYPYAVPIHAYVDPQVTRQRLDPVMNEIFAQNAMDLEIGIKSVLSAINAQLARAAKK